MAEDKKSFVLYTDLIHTVRKLSMEDQAKLFMAILTYVNDEKSEVNSFIVDVVFEPIKHQLKRDLIKYEAIRKKRKEYGRLAGIASGESRKSISKSEPNGTVGSPGNQNEPNGTVGSINEPTVPFGSPGNQNEHVNVNGNGNVNGNVNVNANDIISIEIKEKLKNESFLNELFKSELWVESILMKNKMGNEKNAKVKLLKWMNEFNVKLLSECDSKICQNDYGAHFSRWLTSEIAKSSKSNSMNSNDPYFQKLSKPKFLS